MGYCISMDRVDIRIPVKYKKKIIECFKSIDTKGNQYKGVNPKGRLGSTYNDDHYSWVSNGFSELDTIEEMFSEWRYQCEKTATHYHITEFTGEKIGDCTVMWKALESLIETDSIIEVRGEDGEEWRWTFKNNKFKESYASKVYEDDEEEEEKINNKKAKKVSTIIENCFEILKLSPSASKEEVNKAYKTEMKKYHPDNFTALSPEFENVALTKSKELNSAKASCLKMIKNRT